MINVALATYDALPDGADDDRALDAAFQRLGVRSSFVVWDDDGIDWTAFDICLLRSTWDYHLQRERFLAWAQHVGSQTTLVHAAAVLRWNTHKRYLLDLLIWGVPTVQTIMVTEGRHTSLRSLRELGADDVVIKPAVGASAHGVVRAPSAAASTLTAIHDLAGSTDVLVQPLLAGVQDVGETSVMIIDGMITHAIRKTPRPGEFRVQEHLGGANRPVDPSAAEAELARHAVATVQRHLGTEIVYARVDLLPTADGPVVAELELTEPSLSFWAGPAAADRLAAAAVRLAG